jgi:hypothetical protein
MRFALFGVVAVLGVLGCARGPNVSTDALPLRRVVVYRNGVGYFERAGHVEADQVKFRMRQRMVGDFLATLAIVERGGSSVRAASFPLEIEDQQRPSPPLDPRFQSMLKPWPEPEPEPPGEKMRQVVLTLDGREHDLAIGYVAETPLWRPSYRLVVHENGQADLQAWGIVQNLSGEDWRGVTLVLVAGAPLAFESTLGDPVVPERPIVTDTGEVIAAVPEGLTSLEERDEDVVDRYGGEELEAPAEAEAVGEEMAVAPEGAGLTRAAPKRKAERGPGVYEAVKAAEAAPLQPAAAPPPPAPPPPAMSRTERRRLALEEARRQGLSAPRRMSALAAVAVDAGTTRYEIPTPITVPDESATMVLLLSQRVPGEAVLLYAPDAGVADSATHPFRVARFANLTNGLLERGPIAVFERGSFLGQGLLDPLPPKAKATVPFALERSLGVEVDRKSDERGARLFKIEAGEIWIERDVVQRTTYKVKNGGREAAKLLVRHPRDPQMRLYNPPPGTEDNTGQGHALVPIRLRAHARAELIVDERRGLSRQVDWLSDLADEAVRGYLGDSRANPSVAQKLRAAWEIRTRWKGAVDQQKRLVDEETHIDKNARETRLSLKAIEKNTQAADLRARLTKRLTELTKRQEEITRQLVEVRMQINEYQERFRDAVRLLKLLNAPPPRDRR